MIEFGMCKFLKNMNIFTLDSGVFDEDIVLSKVQQVCNKFLRLLFSLIKVIFNQGNIHKDSS